MSELDKSTYMKLADDDKARWNREIEVFKQTLFSAPATSQLPSRPIQTLLVKPKRVCQPFNYYVSDQYSKLKETKGEHSMISNMQKCSENWKLMTDDQKAPYLRLTEKDQVRYDREIKEFNQTGFFTDKTGVSSQTYKPKKQGKKGQGPSKYMLQKY